MKQNEEKTKQTVGLKGLWRFLTGYRRTYLAAIVAVAIATLAMYAVPLVLRLIIDSVLGDMPVDFPPPVARFITDVVTLDRLEQNLWIPAVVIVAITAGAGIFQYLQKKWSATASELSAERARNDLYDHLQHLSYDYHVKAETGDLIQRCTSDVETVRRFMAIQLVEMGRAVFLLLTAYPLMLSLNAPLALISLPLIFVIFGYSSWFFKRVQRVFKEGDEAEGRLSTALQENLTGVRVVRAFARQRFEEEKFQEKNKEYHDLMWRLIQVFARYWASSDLLAMSHMMLTLLLGTWFAVQGSITVGDLVVFLTVEGMLLWPVRSLGPILRDMGKAIVSLGRIREILETPTEYPAESGRKPEITGRVEFEDVRFGYDAEHEVLKGISFAARPGMTVAILGPTGSGKSSLVHLLSRLYDYSSGSIKIDGMELREIDKKWIRSHVGLVLQEPFLYAKSIEANIGLALPNASREQIEHAAQDASVHDVITGFEKGYETLVGERGVTLSGGQKQRVAIARALIAQCPILVFDDSLSAVDTETDVRIRQALARRAKYATTFIISHRVTTLMAADLILVLDEGKIVQSGSHEVLMAEEGLYRRVWSIQNSLEDEMEKELHREPV
ncbi:MAG: ABC transporter ATP-binding protein [Spirochaetota bacterium]